MSEVVYVSVMRERSSAGEWPGEGCIEMGRSDNDYSISFIPLPAICELVYCEHVLTDTPLSNNQINIATLQGSQLKERDHHFSLTHAAGEGVQRRYRIIVDFYPRRISANADIPYKAHHQKRYVVLTRPSDPRSTSLT